MNCLKHWKVSCCIFLHFQRNLLRTYSKRPEKMSVKWRRWDVPKTSILNLFKDLFSLHNFHFFLPNLCLKHYKVSCFNVLCFTSYKLLKVTPRGWRSLDDSRASIFNISSKLISVKIFSVLVEEMWVLDSNKLSALQITVSHRQLPIVWEHWSAKKTWKLQKMTDHFSHTQKKGFSNCQTWKIFFSNFIT